MDLFGFVFVRKLITSAGQRLADSLNRYADALDNALPGTVGQGESRQLGGPPVEIIPEPNGTSSPNGDRPRLVPGRKGGK